MGHRLTKISTRTGDTGETGLGDGRRTSKNAARVCALGEVDELNSAIGLVLAEDPPAEIRGVLEQVQQDLLDLGGELSIAGHAILTAEHLARLDSRIEDWNAQLAPLREFVLPGGTRAAAAAHLARTVCRRAERSVVALAKEETVNPAALQYLNRLSDMLFVAARMLNRDAGRSDVFWKHERKP